MPKLSPRLLLFCRYLIPGLPVWDICCDHGYVGLRAYHQKKFPEIHFVDQVPEIISRLQQKFEAVHRKDSIETKVYFWTAPGEALPALGACSMQGTVLIAGVGAHTILHIIRGLTEGEMGVKNISRFILSPHNGEKFLIDELANTQLFVQHFTQHCSDEIYEGNRCRRVMIFDNKVRL